MTEQSVDDLRRENDELRAGLNDLARRRAAEEAGLDPSCARWIKGDTFDDALADARTLAVQMGTGAVPAPAASPEAAAIQQHLREAHDQAAAMNPDQTDQTSEEG